MTSEDLDSMAASVLAIATANGLQPTADGWLQASLTLGDMRNVISREGGWLQGAYWDDPEATEGWAQNDDEIRQSLDRVTADDQWPACCVIGAGLLVLADSGGLPDSPGLPESVRVVNSCLSGVVPAPVPLPGVGEWAVRYNDTAGRTQGDMVALVEMARRVAWHLAKRAAGLSMVP